MILKISLTKSFYINKSRKTGRPYTMPQQIHTPDLKGKIVTVFGGTGFIGRTLISALARSGAQIQIPSRSKKAVERVKTFGNVGQIVPVICDIKDDKTLEAIISQSDVVINLIGILYQSGKSTFKALHAELPKKIAELSKKYDVEKLVHISAIGVSQDNPCAYLRTKYEGEKALLKAFPNATVLRPSIVFGTDDSFFNKFASLATYMPVLPLPLVGGGQTKFQPVYVCDVVDAILKSISDKSTNGKVYELGGPDVYSFKELMQKMLKEAGRNKALFPLPFWIAKLKSYILQLAPEPLLTPDQVEALKQDNVVSKKANTLKDLGIEPTSLDLILPDYMVQYRPGGQFKKAA